VVGKSQSEIPKAIALEGFLKLVLEAKSNGLSTPKEIHMLKGNGWKLPHQPCSRQRFVQNVSYIFANIL